MNAKNKKGQSFIELIIALLLVSVVLTSVVGLITRGISNNSFNRNKTLATSYSEEAQEWLRGERDINWNTFLAKSSAGTTTWCLTNLSWSLTGTCSSSGYITNTIFKREVALRRIDVSTVSAIITVSWSDNLGQHNSQSTTVFTNWKGNQ